MRKSIIAAVAVLVVVVVAAAGWWVVKLRHDPVASAHQLLAKGDLRGALLELRNGVRDNPANPAAHALLGQVQLLVGDAVAAEKELKQARALHYQGHELVPLLARSYLGQERYRDLLHEFPPDPALPPDQQASLLVSRALAQVALRDTPSARASAAAAERLAPKLAEAPLAAARILAAGGNSVQALVKTDQALALDPNQLEALALKADLARDQGDLEQSVATLDRAVALAPSLPRVHLARARALILAGEDDKAQQDITLALKGEPRNTLALYLQAVLDIRARDWPAADVALQKIQPVLNKVPRGDYYLALVKANVNELEQAAGAITRYAARSPADPDAFRLAARIDLLLGKPADATAALRRATALGGSDIKRPVGAEAQVPPDAAGSVPVGAAAGGASGAAATALAGSVAGTESAADLTQLASTQLGAGDTGGAARDLEQSLENVPRKTDTGATRVLSALAAGDVERAQAALEQLRRDPKADPEVVGNLTGLVRMAQLDFEGARAAWAAAAQASPSSTGLRINLARALVLLDRPAEAEQLLNGILDQQPANPAALRALLELLLSQGRLTDSLAVIHAARRGAPGVVSLLVTDAALRAQSHDYAGAFTVLDEVPLEQAQSPLFLTVRAQILIEQGRTREAADAFRQILLGSPDDQSSRERLMQLLVASDQADEALRLARDGLARAPGNSQLLQAVVSLVYRTQGLPAALAEADAALRDPVNLPAARLLKGSLYAAAKQFPAAVAAYTEEMRAAPFSSLAVALAEALRGDGKPEQATQVLQDWVTKQPDPYVGDILASLYIETHRLDDAEKTLLAVLAERPNDPLALNNLAWIYQQRPDRQPQALALAKKAYLLGPSGPTADTLGWILTRQGDAKLGLMLLRRAAGQLRNDPAVLFHLAAALKQTGKPEDAARLLDAVLTKGGPFDEREQAVQLQAELPPPPAAPPAAAPAPPPPPPPKK